MQRVAIARAIVNNPSIILADEPTGALDTKSGEQVMQILKEIAKDRLVVMVTHNEELARSFSTRIVKMEDGVISSDTHPYKIEDCLEEEKLFLDKVKVEQKHKIKSRTQAKVGKKEKRAKTAMSFKTANGFSLNNLWSKKVRTALTSIAGSIGLIGIMLVLALSNGANAYISNMEEEALSQYPLTIEQTNTDLAAVMQMLASSSEDREQYPDTETIYTEQVLGNLFENLSTVMSSNDLEKLKVYVDSNFNEELGYVKYDYGIDFDVFCNYVQDEYKYMKVNPFLEAIDDVMPGGMGSYEDMVTQFSSMLSLWDEMIENQSLLEKQYELLGNSRWPSNYDEVVIVVDEKNQLSDFTLFALGLVPASEIMEAIFNGEKFAGSTYQVDDLLGMEYMLMTSSDYYNQNGDGSWSAVLDRNEQREISYVESHATSVKVVGVIRPKEGVKVTSINGTVAYTSALKQYLSARAENSSIVKAQKASPTVNVLTGEKIDDETYLALMRSYGVADFNKPTAINFYANSFEDKEGIVAFLEEYNAQTEDDVKYSDNLSIIMGYVEKLTATITGILAGFAGISLIVSSIMIAIIVYTSVLERKKEIGILRSIGARKKDVSNVFISESIWIGAISGVVAIGITYLLILIVNIIIGALLGVPNLAMLKWYEPLTMLALSVVLAVIAGFIPSRIASNKDPVECLRSE